MSKKINSERTTSVEKFESLHELCKFCIIEK